MAEPKHHSLPPPPPAADSGSAPRGGGLFPMGRPKLRVTSEYDSESSAFFNKVSCKILDNLAKLKLNFQSDRQGKMWEPQIFLTSKRFSLQYDVAQSDALLKASFDVIPGLQFRAAHEVKAQQGEVAMVADIAGPAYKIELSSAVPPIGMPCATLKFPRGEISIGRKDEEEEEEKRALSYNVAIKSHTQNGVYTARYSRENMDLQYKYKDGQTTFIPSISLPSNAMSCAIKRRFSPSDKLSYLHKFNTNDWIAVYKHTVGNNYKLKAGYDTEEQLGWASLWVGEEHGKAKTAPRKMKMQITLQVPQDDLRSLALMFRMKKRWDI